MTGLMKRVDLMKALKKNITNEIVVSTYSCALDWIAEGERDLNYFSHGAMGLASSHGLGLALARPERKVVVLDGDGSLLMNLGTLVSIAGQAPRNLILLCFQNDAYEANGGHPIPQANTVDFPGIARSAGIRNASSIRDIAEFERLLPEILKADGPVFVNLHIAQGPSRAGGGYEHLYTEARREGLRQALAHSSR